MSHKRATLEAVKYTEMPPEERPAMVSVDALALWADLLRHRLPVPEEVKIGAMVQANEGTPDGNVAYVEEYQGRLRVQVVGKK